MADSNIVALILAAPSDALRNRLANLASSAGLARELVGDLVVVAGRDADLDALLVRCATELAPTEAAVVRAMRFDGDIRAASALDVLAVALSTESIGTVVARAQHSSMLDALVDGVGVHAMYQPIIEIRSGRTIAFEALLRLELDGRSIPPVEVFRAASDAGRLDVADAAARRAAIDGAAGWIGPRTLFLNLLPDAIVRPDDLDTTDGSVAASGLDRRQVAFEASVPSAGEERHTTRVLSHLRDRGFGVALDDVTADPSALRLVETVRPDAVKIARSMVAELPAVQARAAVATVVGAAHAVGARVVAKGIETAAQLDAVLFVGVDDAQGWQIGQPMRAPGSRARTAS